jgi:hypothetical protein
MNIPLDLNEENEAAIINEDPYNKKLFYQKRSKTSSGKYLKKKCNDSSKIIKKNLCDASFYKNILLTRIPILKWLLYEYKIKYYLVHDLIAGLTIGVMSIPQCMGISLLANLPPVHGLYMSFFPIFIYLLFGTSKHLVVGKLEYL